jgi:hypothetical protein
MNIKKILSAVLLSAATCAASYAETDSLGLPGDNLDLKAVLEIFKKAESPEAFEKALNTKDNKVNNLDLNADGKIDYIRVIDHTKDQSHAVVLQVPVKEGESQDVAVIGLEKTGDEAASLQIVGDEDLYGKDYIIEPAEETKTHSVFSPILAPRVVVNVFFWPAVRFMYRPVYVVYVSPWRWHYYPAWWSPWPPVYWRTYHQHVVHYHPHHHRVYHHRNVHAHGIYKPHRSSSATVYAHRKNSAPGRAGSDRMERRPGKKAVKAPRQQGVQKTEGVRRQPKEMRQGGARAPRQQKEMRQGGGKAPRQQGARGNGGKGGGGRRK